MKPPPFVYHRPGEVEEALDTLAEVGSDGKILAGGQSLVPLMSMRLAAPAHLIDINGLSELGAVRVGNEARARIDGFDRVLLVRQTISKRVGAPAAALAAEDTSPPRPPRDALLGVPLRDRGAGRPTKRDRRELDKFFGSPGAH